MSKNYYNKRRAMFTKNKLCVFCGVEMILPEDVPFHKTKKGWGKRQPPNMCTIEHLYSRLNPLRGQPELTEGARVIICCRKCNVERARWEVSQKKY